MPAPTAPQPVADETIHPHQRKEPAIPLDNRDLFMLLCAALNQPRYRVDKQLNVLPDEINSSE